MRTVALTADFLRHFALGMLLMLLVLPPASAMGADRINLLSIGTLYQGPPQALPTDYPSALNMAAPGTRVTKVDLLGGSYWLVADFHHSSSEQRWILNPHGTIIERIEAVLTGSDGSIQWVNTGYVAHHEYMLHYAKNIRLDPGVSYRLVLHFSSPYYARPPAFTLDTELDFRALASQENFLIVASIGALLALGLFNFFIYSYTGDRPSLYYMLYVLTYAIAWSFTFHLPADLLDFHMLELHYVFFFLLPVFSTLFYVRFLRLKSLFPRLEKLSRINLILPLLLLPSCFFALSWAHTLATIAISIWMLLALVCGIVAWRHGYQPARFFVFAFLALMIPGLIILPANVGLLPSPVENPELFTLLGGTLDGILLAFALADQIRLLRFHLEQLVVERTAELTAAKEQAEVVSRHRIDFLSAMSHDIRTPLAGVLGMLRFSLRDQSVRGRTQEYLRIALHNGEALLAILNDILDFSKIDAGKLTLETLDFRLRELLDDAIGILRGHADAKSLILRADLEPGLPEVVVGDPTRIRQILLNLLGNAIKFTERGEVCLSARVLSQQGDDVQVEFAVADTGPGIDDKTQDRLFQKFEQADKSTTRRYGGTGLGLAICKELVTLMGGKIHLLSEVGIGSRFAFELPLRLGNLSLPVPTDPPSLLRHAHSLRVLCAEDVRSNQIIIATLLESMGHHAVVVDNGQDALAALAREDFDLVLMDGRMPYLDGEQATLLVRAGGNEDYRVRNPKVRIVALTANASSVDAERYLAAGMDSYLSKPVNEAMLYAELETAIGLLLNQGIELPRVNNDPATREQDLARQFGTAENDTLDNGMVRMQAPPGLSPKHIERLRQVFIEEAPRRADQGRIALQEGDVQGACEAYHALKGTSGYLSSLQLHGLAHRMEQLCSQGKGAEAGQLLDELERVLAQAVHDLKLPAAAASYIKVH